MRCPESGVRWPLRTWSCAPFLFPMLWLAMAASAAPLPDEPRFHVWGTSR